MNGNFNLADALLSLCPGSEWSYSNEDYDSINWLDKKQTKPSKAAVEAELQRLRDEWVSKEYQRARAAEYPPFSDYLDGIVNGDQAQIQAYIDACLAVKEKYPKT